mgnify:CR=1 FL=1
MGWAEKLEGSEQEDKPVSPWASKLDSSPVEEPEQSYGERAVDLTLDVATEMPDLLRKYGAFKGDIVRRVGDELYKTGDGMAELASAAVETV